MSKAIPDGFIDQVNHVKDLKEEVYDALRNKLRTVEELNQAKTNDLDASMALEEAKNELDDAEERLQASLEAYNNP